MGNTIQIWKTNANGSIEPERVQLGDDISALDQATRLLPSGAYTTLRTFDHNRVLRFQDHHRRLEETARLAGMPVEINAAALRHALGSALDQYASGDVRVRLSLDLTSKMGDLYILLEPLHAPDPNDYLHGVRAVSRVMHRDNPKAKLTSFIATADDIRKELPEGINEAVMIGDDGRYLEGLSSNFYGVIDGVVWTAGQGVLSGITRSMVLEAARSMNIPVRLEGVFAADFPRLDEAFITSASRAVLPVIEIDGQPVGSGKPGPIASSLLLTYREHLERDLEAID